MRQAVLISVWLLAGLASQPAWAFPVTVSGTVTDAATRQPLANVEVAATLQTRSPVRAVAITSADGAFTCALEASQAAFLLLTATAPGYQTATHQRQLTPESSSLQIRLSLSRYPLTWPSPSPSPSPGAGPLALTINRGAASTNAADVTLQINARVAGNAISRMAVSNDGLRWSPPRPFAPTTAWQLGGGDGLKTVYATLYDDRTATWLAPANDTIRLDTTPPRVTITAPIDGATVGLEPPR